MNSLRSMLLPAPRCLSRCCGAALLPQPPGPGAPPVRAPQGTTASIPPSKHFREVLL